MGLMDALLLDPYPFEIFLAVRTDGIKGSGTLNDPYDASTTARFDAIMKSLPGSTLVHLGPGIFQTNGYSDDLSNPWQIRPGMRIVGSGIGARSDRRRFGKRKMGQAVRGRNSAQRGIDMDWGGRGECG